MTARKLLATVMMLLVCAAASTLPAFAEGRCPPGQYPVGGPGWAGCAPIPGAGGAGAAPQRLQPSGEWTTTWGAISLSSATGKVGTATGELKESVAQAKAQARCVQSGGTGCTTAYAYNNQCAVLLGPAPGASVRAAALGRGATVEAATADAQRSCGPNGSGQCVVAYYDCTQPIFNKL